MEDTDIRVLARLLRLEQLWQSFPEELLAGARMAAEERAALQAWSDRSAEPWPPMRLP